LPSPRADARVQGERDIAAFDARAGGYERGGLGIFHRQVAGRTAAVALSSDSAPRRILDVGCGTGYLLRLLASRSPETEELRGVDPAPSMVEIASRESTDPRIALQIGVAEALPFEDGAFELVLSTTSFDHWADQSAGVRECARVLSPGGRLVVADLISVLLAPTLIGSRRGKARTKRRVEALLADAGLDPLAWHPIHALVGAVVATPR
jgi:ubiquinone/menaquinone biosynthesis C-methylase UbiE